MAPRLELQQILKEIAGDGKVYFQPPEDIKLEFPCIIYERDDIRLEFADNVLYRNKTRYQVTVVTENSDDDEMHGRILMLPLCSYSRFYKADHLNHDVYNLYF